MAKIILATENVVLREIALAKERITIGRGPHNDIVIDDRAISAEHAVIVTVNDDSFLEDLNSTNGTQVNGQPVRQHFLRDGDVVELARYRITYLAKSPDRGEGLQVIAIGNACQGLRGKRGTAFVRIMNGPSAGKEIVLAKALTTLGHPSKQVVAIARRLHAYYLAYIDGTSPPILNGKLLGIEPIKMANGDIIELSGVHLEFFVNLR